MDAKDYEEVDYASFKSIMIHQNETGDETNLIKRIQWQSASELSILYYIERKLSFGQDKKINRHSCSSWDSGCLIGKYNIEDRTFSSLDSDPGGSFPET